MITLANVSVLYREPKLLKGNTGFVFLSDVVVSVLYREPKLLKGRMSDGRVGAIRIVSVLYREPKLLKAVEGVGAWAVYAWFQCSTVSRNC